MVYQGQPRHRGHQGAEDAAADRVKHGDKSSLAQDDHDPMRLTSFGDDSTKRPASENSIGDALVDEGDEAPKLCLSLMKICTPTATDGLPSAGTACTAMRTIVPRPFFSWSLGEETKINTGRTNFNQLAPPC